MRSLLPSSLCLAVLVAPVVAAQDALAPAPEAPPAVVADETPEETVLLVYLPEGVSPESLPEIEGLEQIDTDTKFGIGAGGSFYAYGISGTIDLTPQITAEAILGGLGTYTSIGGRLWYRFNTNEAYDIYGFGSLSFLSYDFGIAGVDDESAIAIGGGAGVQVGLPQLIGDEDFPPIFLNFDIGVGFATFDRYNDFSSFSGGSGIHFRF